MKTQDFSVVLGQGAGAAFDHLRELRLTDGTFAEKQRVVYPVTVALLARVNGTANETRELAQLLANANGAALFPDRYSAVQIAVNGGEALLFLPPDVFDPRDPWAEIFRRGMEKVPTAGKCLFECGAGSGSTLISIIKSGRAPRVIYANDIDPHVLEVCRLNLTLNCAEEIREQGISVQFVCGDAADVLTDLAKSGVRFDYIIGCLPQVPAAGDDLTRGQVESHEYDDKKHGSMTEWGLGLVVDVKRAGKKALAPGGKFVFVHSGRVPQGRRRVMDERWLKCRETEVVHTEVVRHHVGTPLTYLFGKMETDGLLFSDAAGTTPISPEEAEENRKAFVAGSVGEAEYCVYHTVLIVASEPWGS